MGGELAAIVASVKGVSENLCWASSTTEMKHINSNSNFCCDNDNKIQSDPQLRKPYPIYVLNLAFFPRIAEKDRKLPEYAIPQSDVIP